MSKFNTTNTRSRAGESFIQSSATSDTRTHNGAAGFSRSEKSELFLAAVSDFAGEGSFYESSNDRTARLNALAHSVARQDPEWYGKFVHWLRNDANMRSISLVLGLEGAKSLIDAKIPGGRKVVADVIARADEPGEALAYWTSTYGRKIPSAVKRGIADAASNTYNEFTLGKYDTGSKGFRFADVIRLTHPTPQSPVQSDVFKFAMDRRVDASAPAPASLKMAENRKRILALPKTELRALLTGENASAELKAAGLTWENIGGAAGLDAEIWTALIPTMGYMALLRNLRNFEEKGVPVKVLREVADRIADADQVARSRQLPFRFLAAHRATRGQSLRFGQPLEDALNASLANVPALDGNTLVLVDRSGSMFWEMSKNTDMSFADTAALFGSALAIRAKNATLVQYGTSFEEVKFTKGSSVLNVVDSFGSMGGTATEEAIRRYFVKGVHTRVIILTDEQTSPYRGFGYHRGEPTDVVPDNIPVYTWNLAGYKASQGASKPNRSYFGGLSDQSFKLIPMLESGANSTWPWEA